MNEDRTCAKASTKLTQPGSRAVRKQWHRQRRASRDAGDHIREEQIKLLLDMDRHGAPEAYKVRQMRIVNRVRVVAGREA